MRICSFVVLEVTCSVGFMKGQVTHGVLHGPDPLGMYCGLTSVLVNICFKFLARLCTTMKLYVNRSVSSGEEDKIRVFLIGSYKRVGCMGYRLL